MLAKTITFVGSSQYQQRRSGTIGVTLPMCERLQHHVRAFLRYKTSQEKYKFHIIGNPPLVTKTARWRKFRGDVDAVTTYHNLTVRNSAVQQLLSFLLRSCDQALRPAQHNIAKNCVVDTFHPDIPNDWVEHTHGFDHVRPRESAADASDLRS